MSEFNCPYCGEEHNMSPKMSNELKKYQITLNEEQLKLFESALDLYTRLACGQFDRLVDHVLANPYCEGKCASDFDLNGLNELKWEMLMQFPNAFLGIFHKGLHPWIHQGYDMQKTIQKQIADNKHHKNSVWHDGNFPKASKADLIEIKRLKNEQK